jgi:hypothetical protein
MLRHPPQVTYSARPGMDATVHTEPDLAPPTGAGGGEGKSLTTEGRSTRKYGSSSAFHCLDEWSADEDFPAYTMGSPRTCWR